MTPRRISDESVQAMLEGAARGENVDERPLLDLRDERALSAQLAEALRRLTAWFDGASDFEEAEAEKCDVRGDFPGLAVACRADADHHRKMASAGRAALAAYEAHTKEGA